MVWETKLSVWWTFGLNITNLSKFDEPCNVHMFMGQNFTWNQFMTSKLPNVGKNLISIRLLTYM